MERIIKSIVLILIFSLPCGSAFSYLGPGASVGFIGAVFGIIVAIFVFFFGILYFPIKRLFKNRKKKVEKVINEQKR